VGARRDDTGAAAVEFALLVPILLLLVFGIMEYGLTLFDMQGANAGAREGARRAAVGQAPSCAVVKGAVGAAAAGVDITSVAISYPGGTGVVGDTMQVTVNFTAHTSGVLIPATWAMSTQAQVRVESTPTPGATAC
jgi:Flp pilus assembly protein TadG